MKGRAPRNNNGSSIRQLAWKSIKSSGMRNVFVILTIVLSVSLLMVIALFYAGMNTAEKRQTEHMQHAIYSGLTLKQLSDMAEDEKSAYVLGMKQGQGIEIDGIMVSPVAYGSEALKDEGVNMEILTPSKGEAPRGENEILLADVYCELAGIDEEPGTEVSFTWLDGTEETYILSGVYQAQENQPFYNVVFSEAYAQNGSQMKDIPWQGVVCLDGAGEMTQTEFEDAVYSFGEAFGVVRRNININNNFLDALPGGEKQAQETVVIAGVGAGLLFVSVLVIYSVFYLSVVGRIRQFGQLRTIGMTQRQIRRMVRIEGMFLCAAGIPIGLLIGGVVSYFIRPAGWSWKNTLAISAIVAAASVVTVLFSVRRPAKTAASVSPVEAAKYGGYTSEKQEKPGRKKRRKMARRLTAVSLAVISSARNKKKTAMTFASLGIGGVLFMLAAFWVSSTDLEGYARSGEFEYGEFVIDYSYNMSATAEHGQMELQAEHPMDEKLIREIEAIDGVKEVVPGRALAADLEANGDGGRVTVGEFPEEKEEELNRVTSQGTVSYSDMVQNDGIVCTDGETWEEIYGWKIQAGDEMKLIWYDGQQEREREFTVTAVLDRRAFNAENILGAPNNRAFFFLLPDTVLREMAGSTDLTETLVVKTDMEKEDEIEDALNLLLEQYPYLSLDTLREQMLYTESMFMLLFSVLVGLSLFIIAFALINLLNTLITNILTRDHEFAMLQSVGMTKRQLSGMLRTEGLILAGGNLFITFVLGTAAGYVMIWILRYFGADYMHFVFPVWFFLGYALFIVLVPVLITEYMVKRFQKRTLVERLREY